MREIGVKIYLTRNEMLRKKWKLRSNRYKPRLLNSNKNIHAMPKISNPIKFICNQFEKLTNIIENNKLILRLKVLISVRVLQWFTSNKCRQKTQDYTETTNEQRQRGKTRNTQDKTENYYGDTVINQNRYLRFKKTEMGRMFSHHHRHHNRHHRIQIA